MINEKQVMEFAQRMADAVSESLPGIRRAPQLRGTNLARVGQVVGVPITPCRKCDRRVDGWRRLLFWRAIHNRTCRQHRRNRAEIKRAITPDERPRPAWLG